MGDAMFSVDDKELKAMMRDFENLKPSQIKAIEREVVNDQAFAARKHAMEKEIPAMFHNRTKWIVSSILVDKAKKGMDPIQSEYGAKKRWGKNPSSDFLGMAIQEMGGSIERPVAIETADARSGGLFANKVLASARIGKLEPIQTDSDFGSSRVGYMAMFRKLGRENFKGGMKISRNYPGLRKGIYRFKGRQFTGSNGLLMRPIQLVLDLSKRSARTKKKTWMRNTNKKAVTKQFTMQSFVKHFRRFTAPR